MLLYYYKALFRPVADYRAPAKKKTYRVSGKKRRVEEENVSEYRVALLEYDRRRARQKEEDDFVIGNLV